MTSRTLEILIGTHIENPAALPERGRPPLMKRMCGRCDLVLGWVICVPAQAGKITTGLCTACAALASKEMDALSADEEELARLRAKMERGEALTNAERCRR